MNDSALIMRAMDSFRARHRVHRLDALETTNTPGYWRLKETCTGECGAGHTRAIRHSVHYAEPNARNAQGQFASPFRAWRAWKRMEAAQKNHPAPNPPATSASE